MVQQHSALVTGRVRRPIEYAEGSSWEEWQREYRYGAFYIFPPDKVAKQIDKLRRIYDPKSFSYCHTHISLSEPLPGPLTDVQEEELRRVLAAVKPFKITYGPLRSYPPHPGVVYEIQPEHEFYKLRSVVHSTSIFAGVNLKRKDIPPHMTIAEFISMERTNELLRELKGKVPEGSFKCDAVWYAVPNEDFHFVRRFKILLGH